MHYQNINDERPGKKLNECYYLMDSDMHVSLMKAKLHSKSFWHRTNIHNLINTSQFKIAENSLSIIILITSWSIGPLTAVHTFLKYKLKSEIYETS